MPRLLLATAGTHRNGATLTADDLADVAATGNAQGGAPLTVGHVTGSSPRYGSVTNFSTGDATDPLTGTPTTGLFADVEPLPAVADAVRDGFFNQRSIGIRRGPDGRYYPHHLAVLGGTPPAIAGLPELAFADEVPADEVRVDFYDGSPLTRVLSNEIDRAADSDAFADRDAVVAAMASGAGIDPVSVGHVLAGEIGQPSTEWLRSFARTLGVSEQTLVDVQDFWFSDRPVSAAPVPPHTAPATPPMATETTQPPPDAPETPPAAVDFSDSDEYRAMRAELDAVKADRKAAEIAGLRSDLAGRVSADGIDKIAAFADAAFDAGAAKIDFSDGDTTRQATPIAELRAVLREAIPAREAEGMVEFADAADLAQTDEMKELREAASQA